MKTFPKAIFLVLATTVASASADTTLWQKIWGDHEHQQLQSAAAADEGQESHLEVIHALMSEITSELEDEDYDEGGEYGKLSLLAEKSDEKLQLPTVRSDGICGGLERQACKRASSCRWQGRGCGSRRPSTRRPTRRPSKAPKTNKPTRKPTPSSKPTRRPSRRPTRKPTGTRRPTRRPTRKNLSSRSKSSKSSKGSRKSSSRCPQGVDDYEPKSTRRSNRYRFALKKSNAMCVDKKGRAYTYGVFDDVTEFSDCADKCVQDVRSQVLSRFRGYEWDCAYHECRCLYDRDVLNNNRNRQRYDDTNRDGRGKGPIRDTKKDEGVYCAKLESFEFVGMGNEYDDNEEKIEAEVSRVLMGVI